MITFARSGFSSLPPSFNSKGHERQDGGRRREKKDGRARARVRGRRRHSAGLEGRKEKAGLIRRDQTARASCAVQMGSNVDRNGVCRDF